MKIIQSLGVVSAILLASPAHAKFFSCKAVGLHLGKRAEATTLPIPTFDSEQTEGGSAGIAFLDGLSAKCRSGGKFYALYFVGLAGSLHFDNSYFTLSCPLVSSRRFERYHSTGWHRGYRGARFIGARVTATAGVGAQAGVFVNHALGACVLAGANLGVGAGAAAGSMMIHPIDEETQVGPWLDAMEANFGM